MKKQILVLASLFALLFSSVQAEMGVNIGISGQMGLFGASATETEDSEKQREDQIRSRLCLFFTTASVRTNCTGDHQFHQHSRIITHP